MTSRFPGSILTRVMFGAALCLLLPAAVRAQSLGLAPAEIRATFTPGEPVRFDLTVSNEGSQPIQLRTSVTDLWYTDKNEKIFGAPGSQPRSAANWIEFVPHDLEVPANGTADVKVVVTPPASASGGYYAVIFVESRPQLDQAATATSRAVYTNMRLGALVLLGAAGTETRTLHIDSATLTPPSETADLHLDLQVTNTGNTHLFPIARLALLEQGSRRMLARAQADPRRLLPGQHDTIGLDWSGTLPPGSYIGLLTLLYDDDHVETRELPFVVTHGIGAAPDR